MSPLAGGAPATTGLAWGKQDHRGPSQRVVRPDSELTVVAAGLRDLLPAVFSGGL